VTPTSHPSPFLTDVCSRTVSYPYWDFLLDSDLGENWTQSILYSDDWFGPADTYAEDDYRLRGRFRDTKKIVDIDHTMFPEAGHR